MGAGALLGVALGRRRTRRPRSSKPRTAAVAGAPHSAADNGAQEIKADGSSKPKKRRSTSGGSAPDANIGPLAKLKPSANCVPIADGTLAVVSWQRA